MAATSQKSVGSGPDGSEKRREAVEWVEIVEPRSGEHMYANLTTGECAWEPPAGVAVKPTDAAQWWELFDPNTARFYYYNAASQSTVWHRPHHADIIPLAKLQHHHHHHHRQLSASRGESAESKRDAGPRNPLQEALDRQIAQAAAAAPASLPPASPDEAALKLKVTDEITAEVQRFFEANQERMAQSRPVDKFPVEGPRPKAEGKSKPEGRFARAFMESLESNGPPPLPPHGGRRGEAGNESPILPIRQASNSAVFANDPYIRSGSSTLGNRRGDGSVDKSSSFRRQSPEVAKIVKTSRVGEMEDSLVSLNSAQEMTQESESSGSRDSTPNPTRRQRSLDLPSAMRSQPLSTPISPLMNRQKKYVTPPTVKEAQITAIAGSPKLWGSKAGAREGTREGRDDAPRTTPKEDSSPVWAARSELAMIKSLDSGIRSGDSTADRGPEEPPPDARPSRLSPSSPKDTAISAPSPQPKPRLSIRNNQAPATLGARDKELVSLAQPYQQLAPHLTYSQQHQQLILGDGERLNRSMDTSGSGKRREGGSSDEEEELLDEDDVFADDEDFGSQASPTSSREDLRRGDGRGSGRRRVGSSPPPASPQAHYHPPPRHTAAHTSPEQLFLNTEALNGNFIKFANSQNGNRRSGDSTLPSNAASHRNSMDKPMMSYPGDITPPSHRPQSMLVGASPQQHQLPPNTATLSRPPKRTPPDTVAVSRSASSLTKAQQLAFHDGGETPADATLPINCHKKGFFGKRQSLQTMMTWSRDTLKKPLIMTNAKEVKKEACGVFKRIQGYMGDRKVKAGVSTDQLALDIVSKGWTHPALRDEIFIQLSKQTTDNPKTESLRRGWELLAICLSIFAPSESMLSYMEAYVARNADPVLDPPEVPVSHYAAHCAKKLERALQEIQQPNGTGGGSKRGLRKPTLEEVEEARIQIFHPSMFGNTLEEVMANQRDKFPLRQLPWIQTTLSEIVLTLNGAQTEGIFRVPGDIDEVNALKVRMDRWLVPQVPDPHVPASLLKLWYRELAQPLIPPNLYDDCLLAAENPEAACAIVERLPRINRLVLAYLIRFLQVFVRAENHAATKMDASNLAMVMAPNILRCHSEDPRVIFENTRKEMAFLRTLMNSYDTAFMEGLL